MHVPLGDTYYFCFSTRSFSTGAPTTLAGTPALSVKEEGNDTVITSGVSVDVDTVTGGVTGLHEASVVATSGNGYEVGKYYTVYISTGTVGGVSVVGEVVGHFRVMPAEDAGAGIPDVNATHIGDTAQTGNDVGADVNAILLDTGTDGVVIAAAQTVATVTDVTNGVSLANGAITNASLAGNMEIVFETDFATNYNATRNAWATNVQDFVGTSAADPFNGQVVAASVTGAVGSVTGAVGSVTGNVGGDVAGSVASVTAGVSLANGAITDASLAGNMEIVFETDFATNYNATRNAWATNVQDFVGTSGADPFNGQVVAASVTAEVSADATKISGSAAAANNLEASALGIVTGTAQTGSTTTVIETNLTEAVDDVYIGRVIVFTGGTAAGEATDITDYDGTTKQLTVTATAQTAANGDTFVIV